jgi:xanthine dehydrogenase accessory factor
VWNKDTSARGARLFPGRKDEPDWWLEPLATSDLPLVLYGAGHVGRALVRALEGLPFRITWMDERPAAFPDGIAPQVIVQNQPVDPALLMRTLPANAIHIVMTHSHPLDLAICHAVLQQDDFRFLGLIGSATKRARFLKRLRELGIAEAQLGRLVCPIGLPGIADKRPAAIAVATAAQLLQIASG